MSFIVRDPREITFELLMHADAQEKLYVKFIMKIILFVFLMSYLFNRYSISDFMYTVWLVFKYFGLRFMVVDGDLT